MNILNKKIILLAVAVSLFISTDSYSMMRKKLEKRKAETGRKSTPSQDYKKRINLLVESCELPEEKNEFSESSSDDVEKDYLQTNKTKFGKIQRSKTFYGQDLGEPENYNSESENENFEKIDFNKEEFTQVFADDEYYGTDIEELNEKVLQIAKKEYTSFGAIDPLFVTFCQLFVINYEKFKKDDSSLEDLVDFIIEDMVGNCHSNIIDTNTLNEIWFYYFYKLEGIAISMGDDIHRALFSRTSLNKLITSERIKKSGLSKDEIIENAQYIEFNLN